MHVRAGFFLKTHDFLQPLERPPPPQSPPPQAPAEKLLHQHALPGGIGTFSISHGGAATAVKQEQQQQQPQPFALWGQPDPRGTPRARGLFSSPLVPVLALLWLKGRVAS